EGNINSVSKNSLPPGLIYFSSFHNPLTNLSEDAFDASAGTLQFVSLSESQFTGIPTALQKLASLTQLAIRDTLIEQWDPAIVKQLATTLKELELRNVSLSAWPSWISDFRLLHKLDLSWNSLRFIPDDAFSSVKDSLVILDLRGNGLTHVPYALSILSNLSRLHLSYSNFTNVPALEFITETQIAQKLSYLDLDSSGLTRIANFSVLTSLDTLSLSGNRISQVPPVSLPASLSVLYLSDNFLSFVPADIARMSNLSFLALSGNLITWIEPNVFPPSLTYLQLSYNNLTTITNATFANLSLLMDLYLDANPISELCLAAFSELVSLKYLSMVDSQLTEIPLAFTHLSTEVHLYWTTNQPLTCPCPASQELIQWFTSRAFAEYIQVKCNSEQSIRSYLSDQCGRASTAS
ncbi:unnamed protein product, partial [Candidula unifasciata]